MLDIKIIRENPDKVKAALKTRNADYDSYIDEILEIDEKRRKLSTETERFKKLNRTRYQSRFRL